MGLSYSIEELEGLINNKRNCLYNGLHRKWREIDPVDIHLYEQMEPLYRNLCDTLLQYKTKDLRNVHRDLLELRALNNQRRFKFDTRVFDSLESVIVLITMKLEKEGNKPHFN